MKNGRSMTCYNSVIALLLKGVSTYMNAQVLKKLVSFFRNLETQNQEYKQGKTVFTK